MPRPPDPAPSVAELQGLYGPFSFPEKLLQKIWLRGDFNRDGAQTTDGRRVVVRHAGKWNLLGGPDFRGARLCIGDDDEIIGDVELHVHAADWTAHGHAADPAYDRVALHVVLFPPAAGHVSVGAGGRQLPVLALLPLLHHDLEEYAAEEAVESLAGRASARVPEELACLEPAILLARLRGHAEARWRQKVHFARLRVQRLGWEEACHHAALEILGFRFNRAVMLRVAARWPLRAWAAGKIEPEAVYVSELDAWSLQGVRPANHPRRRLRQYAAWTAAGGDWPERLFAWAEQWPEPDPAVGTREARRVHGFGQLRGEIARTICGAAVGGTRLDNLICDGFLPLVAARSGRSGCGRWFHWFPADLPPLLTRGLRELGVFDGRASPANHGTAQGLLGWWVEREARR